MVFGVGPHQQAREHGHDGQRQDERPREREKHGRRHRAEQLSLDARQGEHGEIDDRDDGFAEDAGGAHFERGLLDRLEPLLCGEGPPREGLRLGKPADRVLDDDDSAVDQEPEVDRAEAHQIP